LVDQIENRSDTAATANERRGTPPLMQLRQIVKNRLTAGRNLGDR
jgi:hypothetical protein